MATLVSIRPLVEQGAEHIVVDSGSTDGTAELCRCAGARVITHPVGNIYAAINAGIGASTGEWLTYINGDDLLHGESIAAALAVGPAGADIIYGNIELIDDAGKLLYDWRMPPPAWVRRFQPQVDLVLQQGTLIRREAWAALGGFDESFSYAADYDFFLRASLAGKTFGKHRTSPVAAFRAHASQLSRRAEVRRAMREECRRSRGRAGVRNSAFIRVLALSLMKLLNLDTILMRLPRALSRGRLWTSYSRM